MKVRLGIALLFITAIGFAETMPPAALLKGVALHKRKRLQVRDIVAGNVSVRQLFQPVPETPPSAIEYYVTTASDTVTIRVIGREQLQNLLETMAIQHTSTFKVILRDDRKTFLRHKWPFDDSYFNAVREWTIEETPCEQITHIAYRKIRDSVREQFREGSTSRHVSLNAVFDLLLHDDIDKFLQSLGPMRSTPPCLKTYQLYQWLKGEDVAGFAFGRYELTDGIRSSLRPVANALLDTRRDWQRYRLRIRVVGYADASKVETKKELRANATGVNLRDPLDIRYLGCSGDTLTSKTPSYVSGTVNGIPIGQQVINNCQLGAVRAYVAVAYFEEVLGHENVDYEYATGGVHPLATKRDAAHRKLDIDLDLRAASGER